MARQYSCLESSMDGGAWWAAVPGVTGHNWATSLSLFTFMHWRRTTHFSVLAWRIPGTAEPGGLPSMGSRRVGHYWSDLAARVKLGTSEKELWVVSRSISWLIESRDSNRYLYTCVQSNVFHSSQKEEIIQISIKRNTVLYLKWRIPWTEEPGKLQSMGVTKSQTQLSDYHFHFMEFSRPEYWNGYLSLL